MTSPLFSGYQPVSGACSSRGDGARGAAPGAPVSCSDTEVWNIAVVSLNIPEMTGRVRGWCNSKEIRELQKSGWRN